MPSEAALIEALRQADAAGNTADAQRFAEMIKAQRATAAAPAEGPQPSALSASLNGIVDTATFGLASKGLARMEQGLSHILPGPVESYDEALANVRRHQQIDNEASPIAKGVGDVVGAVLGGGALERGAGAALTKLAPSFANSGRAMLALKRGQGVKNAARLSARGAIGGGLFGGVQGTVEGAEDGVGTAAVQGLEGTALGAATGAVIGPAAALALKGARAVKTGLSGVSARAIAVLSKQLDETPQQLMKMISDFRDTTGRAPSIAEILNAKSVANASQVVGAGQDASLAAQRAAEGNVAALPKRLAGEISATGPTSDIARLTSQRQAAMDQAMKPLHPAPVVLPSADLDFFADMDIRRALRGNTQLRKIFGEATDTLASGSDARVTVADMDNLRLLLNNKWKVFRNPNSSSYDPAQAARFATLARDVADMAGQQVPAYADALNQYAAHSRFIAGFKHALTDKSVSTVEDTGKQALLGSLEARAGLEVGARSRLVDQAGSSERGALRTAAELKADAGTSDRLTEALGGRARPIRAVGQAEAGATRNLTSLAPGKVLSKSQENAQYSAHVLDAAAASVGRTLTGFKTHVTSRILTASPLLPSTAHKVVDMLVDPAQRDTAIQLLSKARISDWKLRRMLSSAAQAAGITSGAANSEVVNHIN